MGKGLQPLDQRGKGKKGKKEKREEKEKRKKEKNTNLHKNVFIIFVLDLLAMSLFAPQVKYGGDYESSALAL